MMPEKTIVWIRAKLYLTNVQAAIGLAQIEQLEQFLDHRMKIVPVI